MIIDRIENAALYYEVNPLLAQALRYLASGHDFDADPLNEWVHLDADRLYYKVMDVTTFDSDPVSYRYEYHDDYADIHFPVRDPETVAIANRADLALDEPFNHDIDCGFSHGQMQMKFTLQPGSFLVCFPNEGHRVWLGDGRVLRKVLFKIRMTSFANWHGALRH